MHRDSKVYCWSYDACQRTGNPSRRDEFPINPQISLQVFEKWAINFVYLIQPPGKNTGTRYIITTIEHLMIWVEAQSVKDCSAATTANFLFEYVLTWLGALRYK